MRRHWRRRWRWRKGLARCSACTLNCRIAVAIRTDALGFVELRDACAPRILSIVTQKACRFVADRKCTLAHFSGSLIWALIFTLIWRMRAWIHVNDRSDSLVVVLSQHKERNDGNDDTKRCKQRNFSRPMGPEVVTQSAHPLAHAWRRDLLRLGNGLELLAVAFA